MNNFLQRTISGAVFVILIVGSIIWSPYSFAALFTVITALALYEFHKLTNCQQNVDVNPFSAIFGGVLLFISSFMYTFCIPLSLIYLVYGFYVALILVVELYRKKEHPVNNWAYFILGQVYIALPFSILNFILFLPSYQPLVLLAVFVTIWVNDTGAYLVGSKFGKHRLFERISPKKSWEGFIGGAVFALLSGYVFSLFIPQISLIQWLIFAEIVVVAGTFGDLMESLMKRSLGVKDSGNIIPGHGGILDRFDSMILAAPMVFIYIQVLVYFFSK
ncbi:phosphatidate cytidylyltransferase [Paludibacter sp. 221]|uniref:phosphatidate cytidylyltransferase n=1 Tax=Paludibacter sp. 221 TaxID=2302939 RepID=UPI0013D6B61C|nr:phosphatidate cytidylyltransferase [Paludibacter sp. 221]NDV46453.1 phosphatidate cytidylyltransferase [Paludibacter sp. 221]